MKRNAFYAFGLLGFIFICFTVTNIFPLVMGDLGIYGKKELLGLYHPFKLFFWIYKYKISGLAYPISLSAIGILTLIDIIVCVVFYYRLGGKQSGIYGSSRWMKNSELAKKKYTGKNKKGVILGMTNSARYSGNELDGYKPKKLTDIIMSDSSEHVAISAPTRRGKGINNVIPTLLCWTGSVVVYDIKKENYNVTSGWRRKFSHVFNFEPTNPNSVKFNPLYEIEKGVTEVADVQNICEILANPFGEAKKDHWNISAVNLLVGVCLHVLYTEKDKSLYGVYRCLNDPERPIVSFLKEMLTTKHLGDRVHPQVAEVARNSLNKVDENDQPTPELSSIISTASSFLSLYQDPIIAENTSRSDFRVTDLMNRDNPVSLYLVVNPQDADRLRPLTRLMLSLITKKLTATLGGYKHKLLFLIDEFPTLGKMDFIETGIGFFAGYGIKCCLISQSTEQLFKHYSRDTSILSNCRQKVFLGADSVAEAKSVAEYLGAETVKRESTSRSGKASAFFHSNESTSVSEAGRNLMTHDEILRMDFKDIIILFGGDYPYKARKIMYYLDPRFKPRVLDALKPEEQAGELFSNVQIEWLEASAKSPVEVQEDDYLSDDEEPKSEIFSDSSSLENLEVEVYQEEPEEAPEETTSATGQSPDAEVEVLESEEPASPSLENSEVVVYQEEQPEEVKPKDKPDSVKLKPLV